MSCRSAAPPDVERVGEDGVYLRHRVLLPAVGLPAAACPDGRPYPVRRQAYGYVLRRALLDVLAEDAAYDLGLLWDYLQLVRPRVRRVADGREAPRVHPLLFGRRHLVLDALRDDFALVLGEAHQDVQHHPASTRRRVYVLRYRNELDVVLLEELEQLREVVCRPRQAVDLVHDHHVDLSVLDVRLEVLQRGAVGVAARIAPVVVAFGQADPPSVPLEIHDAILAGKPVDADLAGDVAVGGADGRLGRAVVQQRGGGGVRPDRLLQLQDEAEVLLADDLFRLRGQPVGVCLGGLAVGLAGLRVHWAVGDKELLVECSASFKDEAVCGASKRQRWAFGLGDFAAGLAAIEFGGFAEVGQKVARHVLAALACGVVLVRRDCEEFSCVHWWLLMVCSWEVSFSRHQCIQENRPDVR